ncbi:uncharacterized protein LOC116257753 isoform X2 [Nymphaea colorata]|uniref:uncharacterized protein LOC116257753 isoform X2 n=1 Tax=Nymphaea colorata TaxID=210225 RepID=UPI00129D5A91|nr:uncharacterized protein LOC116257753 isoform X2 [Nymphaea colorata]
MVTHRPQKMKIPEYRAEPTGQGKRSKEEGFDPSNLRSRRLFLFPATMLENPASDPSIKRYTPPGRNRLLNRRKSSDRFDRINNSQSNEGEKGSSTFRNTSAADHGDSVSCNYQSESSNSGFIVVEGCSSSEAVQLMVERWAVAMDSYNDPSIGITEKPVIYSGSSGSAWGSVKLPHQMDFLAELRRAIQMANAQSANTGSRDSPPGRS